jgi:cyclopropane fatty-acyl-phospholipid synthase-like methyltransferase
MDRVRFSIIAHGELEVWNPVDLRTQLSLVAEVGLGPDSTVLDVGCGRGELLRRIRQQYGCDCLGIDRENQVIELAESHSQPPDPGGNLSFRAEPFSGDRFTPRSLDLVICMGSTHAVGTYLETLGVLGGLVKPGACLLVGEGFWETDPPAEYLRFLSISRDELLDHPGNIQAGVKAGFEIIAERRSTQEQWDHYETTYADNVDRYLAMNPRDPEAGLMRSRINGWRDAYHKWGRGTLGFGVYLFRSRV